MSDKILVPLNKSYGKAVAGLGEITDVVYDFFDKPEDFKLVLFTGGEDVSPALYEDESPLGWCGYNLKRDTYEAKIFDHARKHGIKMTGICRGTQFINVMSGGRMIHHLNGHTGSVHELECLKDNEIRIVNSLHHQMIVPPREDNIIAWSSNRLSDLYVGKNDETEEWGGPEVEAILIPETLCCGVQWHPEIMPLGSDGYKFYYQMIVDFLTMDIKEFKNVYGNKELHIKGQEASD